ncbi:LysE family translocator [Desmospora activa]|uniref:Threonine/homoserine/homoserine lactone efflux protein n=1 Tax=Desmospora activa DSM 45169 TaxID=1121389 RepID=A0A2T4Z7C1_9BACL|nr:LysE family translocator [Desmospora activa]PTM57773.1 threonine/homoserine/homoserine lactone efflux protein [Desmospora activa DSM 45169]
MVTFVLVVLALLIIPGPAVMLTLAQSVNGGRKSGIFTGIGIGVGDLIHTIALVLGLSAIIMTSATAFEIIKYLGAAYLVYLGMRTFLQKTESIHIASIHRVDGRRVFHQAVLTEILNPKTALFFLSFLPQFVHPEKGPIVTQLLFLGITFVVLSILYTTLIAIVAGSFVKWLSRNQRIARWQGKVVGSVYLGLGVQMAFQQRN